MSSTAESELVARCRRGEAQAWDELFDLHYAAVGRYVFQLSAQFTREDADDAAGREPVASFAFLASCDMGELGFFAPLEFTRMRAAPLLLAD